ncbi:hypothetical protein SteCoe_29916 [Stentor coeruleus]|uniref:Protein kinase domain-containing protein n=1 Tax=Stentor coeruleus TaxID=5963 RepID=A0A1R2B4Q9_9CILI|nr:hypothetical protein SteCoe_29916 [Stentor coeruleus]
MKKALNFYNKAVHILKHQPKLFNYDLVDVYNSLGLFYLKINENEKALQTFEELKRKYEEIYEPFHPKLGYAYHTLGLVHVFAKRIDKALELYEKCRLIREKCLKAHDIILIETYKDLGILYCLNNDYKKAYEYYEKCRNVLESEHRSCNCDLTMIYFYIGFFFFQIGDKKKALEFYDKCKLILENYFNKNHPLADRLCIILIFFYYLIGEEEVSKKIYETFKEKLNELIKLSKPNSNTIYRYANYIISGSDIWIRAFYEDFYFKNSTCLNYPIIYKEHEIRRYSVIIKNKTDSNLYSSNPRPKAIIPLSQCKIMLPNIYNKSSNHHNVSSGIQENKVYYKKFKKLSTMLKTIFRISKEIKLLKMLSKKSKLFPNFLYYMIIKQNFDSCIKIGIERCNNSLRGYTNQNTNINNREMKILFYNIVKGFYLLKENNIVHNDIKPENILVNSPEDIKICDFDNSFICTKTYKNNEFPAYSTKRWVTEEYCSPELMTYVRLTNKTNYLLYDPFKSDVFSLGLTFLSILRASDNKPISIEGLNMFGINYDVHILEIITKSYDYIVQDSLRQISYNMLRKELQNAIDKKIEGIKNDFLKEPLRKMLEVDMVQRATIDQIYNDAKFMMGIFD